MNHDDDGCRDGIGDDAQCVETPEKPTKYPLQANLAVKNLKKIGFGSYPTLL